MFFFQYKSYKTKRLGYTNILLKQTIQSIVQYDQLGYYFLFMIQLYIAWEKCIKYLQFCTCWDIITT